MADRSAEIRKHCQDWLAAVSTPGGGMALGGGDHQHRLWANGIFPHDLTWDELRAAHIGLSQIMLLPGNISITDADHLHLWAWEAELLAGIHQGWPRWLNDTDYFKFFELVLHVLFQGPAHQNDGSDASRTASTQLRALLNPHANETLIAGTDIVSYLCFPLLEGLLKRRATAFVTPDGEVTAAFDVPKQGGGRRAYNSGGRISSLRDLLFLEREQIADPDLQSDIDELVAGLPAMIPGLTHGFDVIYRWRNTSLHGAGSNPTIGSTILGLTLRIALSELQGDYDAYRTKVRRTSDFYRGTQMEQSGWLYYPPPNGRAPD